MKVELTQIQYVPHTMEYIAYLFIGGNTHRINITYDEAKSLLSSCGYKIEQNTVSIFYVFNPSN